MDTSLGISSVAPTRSTKALPYPQKSRELGARGTRIVEESASNTACRPDQWVYYTTAPR